MTKRKPQPKSEPVIPSEILANAKASIMPDKAKPVSRCVVCGAPGSPSSHDDLCWVCRRLKISAWREIEQQAPIQE